jgi:hypothetical protein
MSDDKIDLKRTEELFAFLQGVLPKGYSIGGDKIPHLTPDQAWTVIWYLGEQHWQVPDCVKRCDVCDSLFDSKKEGGCLDDEKGPPWHFCESCWCGVPECEACREPVREARTCQCNSFLFCQECYDKRAGKCGWCNKEK